MAHSNVASCVLSIVGSFANGLDVFKKLRDKRRRKRRPKKADNVEEQELRLSRSLRQGPEDIGREYQRSLYAAGYDYEMGDAIAQTSLAEIILRLNSGLVGIITSFVNSDKHNVQLDYRSLTDLSERSRIDTCRTLRQLFKRMTEVRRPLAILDNGIENAVQKPTIEDSAVSANRRRKAQNEHTKVRGPMIARVVIADSKKASQIALVKPGERRKKSHSSSSSGSSSLTKAHSQSTTNVTTPTSTPPPEYTVEDYSRPTAHRSRTAPDVPRPRRKQSAANVSTASLPPNREALRAAQSTPWLESTLPPVAEPLPPMPNTAPLSDVATSPMLPRRRKPTPTYYSVASNETKLGEIPLHKWTVPYDFDRMSMLNREAYNNGWPVNQIEQQETKKRRFGFSRLFGR
ncbi:hypothetical protein LTR37_003712 [Vermiconidia calcicola]|uniref:Uncharacterized protein n=1 Tax=Vermiconidia calcicola TaxID=1690605 RepID=A0ACC3NPD4_9PEZI|nr:hypothetical protein LTR37_003712 [Vermiconidia calcicola]